MIDRPLVRRPTIIDPKLDQWMLDRWSNPASHVVRVVYWDRRVPTGRGTTTIDREYRTECACGWRSIETVSPSLDKCPVADALDERLRRMRRPTERIEWVPYVPPPTFRHTSHPDSRD
jgi:hypothetical protein